MANITKTQARKRVKDLLKKIGDLRDELYDLTYEFDLLVDELGDESASIEPYETYNDLTPEQEERQEWLDNCASQIEESVNNIYEAIDSLSDTESDLEDID